MTYVNLSLLCRFLNDDDYENIFQLNGMGKDVVDRKY